MKPVLLNLPDDLDFDEQKMTRFVAAKLYEDRKLSLGNAAKMAGVAKWDFPAILAQFGVAYFDLTGDELEHDLRTA